MQFTILLVMMQDQDHIENCQRKSKISSRFGTSSIFMDSRYGSIDINQFVCRWAVHDAAEVAQRGNDQRADSVPGQRRGQLRRAGMR